MLENVKRDVVEFLKRKEVDYALMINGVWGSGKTYFVQNSLQDEFTATKFSPVYVSLNGVGSFEEVAAQIVFGTGWKVSKSAAKSFLLPFALRYLPEKSVSAILSALQTVGEKKAKGWLGWLHTSKDLSPKAHVLIIDDLERVPDVEKNLVPIMGRVFDEFISRGYHVVFIGDETHIGFSKFKEEKEKYLRRTITFKPDVDAVVDAIASSFVGAAGRYAMLGCADLKRFAVSCGISNIRVIKRIMDDFVTVSERVNDQALIKKIAHILMFRLAPIVAELAAGRLKASDEESISELANIQVQRYAEEYKRLFPETTSQEVVGEGASAKKSYAQEFVERYDGKLSVPWAYDQCIVEYEIEGSLDDKLLKQTVCGWLPAMSDKYAVALNTILGHYSIEDSELAENYPIVEEGLKEGKYNAEHVNLACSLLYHFNKSGWISIDYNVIVKDAVKGLAKRWKDVPADYINPMLLYNRQEDFLKPIVDAIHEETALREQKSAEADVSRFLEALSEKDKETAWRYFPQGNSWLIFDKIVKVGKCREFCSISNWALSLVAANLKDGGVFVRPSSRDAIEQIVKCLDLAIESCDKRKPIRKGALNKVKGCFASILNGPEFGRPSVAQSS